MTYEAVSKESRLFQPLTILRASDWSYKNYDVCSDVIPDNRPSDFLIVSKAN